MTAPCPIAGSGQRQSGPPRNRHTAREVTRWRTDSSSESSSSEALSSASSASMALGTNSLAGLPSSPPMDCSSNLRSSFLSSGQNRQHPPSRASSDVPPTCQGQGYGEAQFGAGQSRSLRRQGPRLSAPSKLSSPLEKCLRSLSSSAALILACESLFRSACEFWPSCLHRGEHCSIDWWVTELYAHCCSKFIAAHAHVAKHADDLHEY